MSTSKIQITKIRPLKKKKVTTWVMTTFFSPYKVVEYQIDSRCFVSKKLALEAMKRTARRLYKNSEIIQDDEDKYFEEYSMEIHFGESPSSSDYRREFGFCKVEPTILEDKESGDEVPSSKDDEDEDDY
ncbi:7482_t:CDS:2 [Funneliformis geosporum]|uniref:7482_t:CDS:1 n=1 Tax=Funneliformis geosporum TaxID=1117311 RepID=A0A9W4WVV8_9GLOM|nr:7482_t:CDS:2 [Funneliformis geosporum]